MARCLAELDEAKLIVWYRIDGNQYVAFPTFAKHQRGAKSDREAPSRFPTYSAPGATLVRSGAEVTPDLVRTTSGPAPELVRVSEVKRSKVKSSEGKDTSRKPRATWLTAFADAWKERYGGSMPMKAHARALREVHDALGAEDALRRWTIYLERTGGQYASAARFAATPDEWKERMILSYRAQMLVEMLLGVKARCQSGAHGSTAARCRLEGYCQAHVTDLPEKAVACV